MSDATEVNKPFECTSPGCKATFTNEDHLSSHQKRHEMSLLLPGGITISRSNSLTLGADLTPTPTRFIRIGEEVGLFQDLLKANPFDEQFRKAAEQNKAASVHLPLPFSGACDEPLNTPHIVHPGEGDHHHAKGAATPAVDTPLPRLASPHRLGSPPPAHVIITPCSPLRARTGAPPAHRDPLDPDDPMAIDDEMEVEGPLDMRSPSVIPSVAETLISPPVIHTPGSMTSPPVIHTPGSMTSSPGIHTPGSLTSPHVAEPPGALTSPHVTQAPGALTSPHVTETSVPLTSHHVTRAPGSSLTSPASIHTPTTVQSSAVSSTVPTSRHHLGVPPPPLRPRPAVSSGPAAPQPAHPAPQPPTPPDAVEFQIKLSDGQVIPLTMQPPAAARLASLPAAAAAGPAAPGTAAVAASGPPSTVREKLKRTLQRVERPPVPAAVVQHSPAADAHLPSARTPQSEDTLRKERNRAAANRWRARKKQAQQQMANSMESLASTVRELRHENAELRSQLAKFKVLLIQHRDCDVTRGLRPLADTDGLERLELDELSRLVTVEGAAAAGVVSPPAAVTEEVRRVARPAPGVPLVFTSAPTVSALPVPSGATHQLILLQPAPAGGSRLPPQPQQQPAQQQHTQATAPLRHYRLPAAAAAGRGSLQPPAHGEPHC